MNLQPWLMELTGRQPAILHDLEKDPDELTNLQGDPAYAGVEKELKGRLERDWNPAQVKSAVMRSQKERRMPKEL